MKLKKGLGCTTFSTRDDDLMAQPIGKRLRICAGFGLGDKILAHSLANVEMRSFHRIKIARWM
jgi:hypothetical protein